MSLIFLVLAERLELPTFRFEVWRSIQLNYARRQKKEGRILLKILSVEEETGASEGAWTLDHWNHNPELYQLSYARHASNTNDLQNIQIIEYFICPQICMYLLTISIYLSPHFTIDPFPCPLSFSSIPISLVLASPILLKKTNSIKPKPSSPVIAPLILHSQTPSK